MKNLLIFLAIFICSCGYTTRGFMYEEDSIVIEPVINKIEVASESRKYSNYVTFPILIEKKLTNELVNQFNIEGNLRVVSRPQNSLRLKCSVYDYRKQTLRYSGDDDVREQRLKLYVKMELISPEEETLIKKNIVGQTTYFLTGPRQKSETAAQMDLIEDTARRLVEAVVEAW